MMRLPCLILVTLLIPYQHANSIKFSYVTVDCRHNCTVTGIFINGGEGDNITLKYVINTTKLVTFDLKYEDIEALQVVSGRLYHKATCPPFIDLSNTTLVSAASAYSFSFKIKNLNNTRHNGKKLNYVLSHGATGVKEHSIINVQFGPKLLGRLVTSYDVQENGILDVNVTISGNPKPNVTGKIEKETIKVTTLSRSSPYTYNIKSQHLHRNQCGLKLTLKVRGYRINYYDSKVNVSFIPSTPTVLSANFTLEKCLFVSWRKIESGACRVKYTILYIYDEGKSNNTNTTYGLQYKRCFGNRNTSFNGTVRVQAEVGGRNGSFSRPKQVIIEIPPATTVTTIPPNVTIQTPTNADREGEYQTPNPEDHDNKIKWYYIVLIPTVATVFIILVIFTLVRTGRLTCANYFKRGKLQTNSINQSSTVEYIPASTLDEEGDYATVDFIAQPIPQPSQDTDYAELGPGGRIGERPLVEPSLYAQVNTVGGYYPPLRSSGASYTEEPEYAD